MVLCRKADVQPSPSAAALAALEERSASRDGCHVEIGRIKQPAPTSFYRGARIYDGYDLDRSCKIAVG